VIQHKADPVSVGWVYLAGIGLMFSVPSLAYRVLERK